MPIGEQFAFTCPVCNARASVTARDIVNADGVVACDYCGTPMVCDDLDGAATNIIQDGMFAERHNWSKSAWEAEMNHRRTGLMAYWRTNTAECIKTMDTPGYLPDELKDKIKAMKGA